MTNLLPSLYQAQISRERRFRFFAMLLFGLSGVFISGVAVLAPLLVGLRARERAQADLVAFSERAHREQESSPEEDQAVLREAKQRVALLDDLRETTSVRGVVEHLVALAGEDIGIRAMLYTDSGNKKEDRAKGEAEESWTIELRGFARTREALTIFKRRLETDPTVGRADIPLEHFVKDRDIDFVVTIVGAS